MYRNSGYYPIKNYLNSNFKIVCGTAVLYFAVAFLSKLLFSSPLNLFPFLPTMGFAVAFAIIFGRKALLGVAIGSMLFSLVCYSQPFLYPGKEVVLEDALAESLVRLLMGVISALMISWATEKWCKTDYPFSEGRQIMCFSIVTLIGAVLAGSVAMIPMILLSAYSKSQFLVIWSNVIRGDILGVILFSPFVLSCLYKDQNPRSWSILEKWEAIALPLITLVVSIYIFGNDRHSEAILYLLLLWGGYRFPLRLICLLCLIIAVVSMYYTSNRWGMILLESWNSDFFLLQLYLFVYMVSILFFKVLLQEKNERERSLEIGKQILSTEKNILKATIESSDATSIFSLDRNLNYLNYNSTHQRFMEEFHGACISVGCNHMDCISPSEKKEEYLSLYREVLKGKTYVKEDNDQRGTYWRVSKMPIKDDADTIIGVTVMVNDISDLKRKGIQLEENNDALNRRIKELSCLYDITKVLNKQSISTSEKLQECVNIIQASFQFSEIANCSIYFWDEEYFSVNYQKPSRSICQSIVLKGVVCGSIEVGYRELVEFETRKDFLEEEYLLLQAVVDIISKSLHTKIAEDSLKVSERNYRTLFENIQDVFFRVSLKNNTFLELSPSCSQFNGIHPHELIGKNIDSIYTDHMQLQRMMEQLYEDNKITDYNNQIEVKGDTFHVSINALISYDTHGMPEFAIGSIRDISKRWQAEERLKISEEKFRSIFENMQDIYYQQNLDGALIEISPSCEKHLGYKREQMIGMDTDKLYFDVSKSCYFRNKIIQEGFINDENVQFITATGESIYFSVNSRIIYNQQGQALYIEGSMRNINERVLNERQLLEADQKIKESEKKYRNIFDNVRDVFFVGSVKEDILIDVSPSCAYFGLEPKDMIGKSIEEFYYDKADRQAILDSRNKYGSITNHVVRYVFNGNLYYVSLNSKIVYNQYKEAELLIGSFTDVTDRVIAEENLKRSEAKFRSIYENFDDIYFKTELDGTILELSPSFEKHFLRSVEECIGASVLDLYFDKNDRLLLLKKLKQQGSVSDFDVQFVDVNHRLQYVSMNAHLVYEKERPVAIEGTLRNVNDRVKIQNEMLAKNRVLEFQNTELEQFAFIASHDLQEPLVTVKHCIELLEEELSEKLEAEQKQYLEFISSSTIRMQTLVKGLLDYSRIGKERNTSLVDCNEVLSDLLSDMESSLKASKARIVYEDLPKVLGNKTEMRQLFQNLISNANKFRKSDQDPIIKISAVQDGKNWLFSIEDNGIGIKKEDMEKIFIIFKRLHNRHEYKGTGIGLSHCKKIVEQHRGKIWVESKFGRGSIFKWTLPVEAVQ